MWTRSHLHAFLKVPPFSPSDCASLFALNEASRFQFDIGAKTIRTLCSLALVLADGWTLASGSQDYPPS